MKTKIALMIFSSVISGAESVVIHMLNNINKEKFDVYFITNEEIFNKINVAGIKKYNVGKLYDRTFVDKVSNKIFGAERFTKKHLEETIKKVEEFVNEEKIEIIHSNLLNDHYVNSKINCPNTKKILTMHGAHGLDGSMKSALSKETVKKVYESSDYVFSACKYFLGLLNDMGTQYNSCIVPNGIDFDLLEQKYTPEVKDEKLNIVYLGGTRNVKGWDLLINALDIVVNQEMRHNIHLNILRDVPRESELYKLAERKKLLNYITFSGYVNNNDHLKHISQCNLYTLPSYSEGIANTLTEAIGYGKPILATNVGGTSELVKHLYNGYLCETTAGSVADGILYYLDNADKLEEFSNVNKKIAMTLSWKEVIKKYEEKYLEIIEG